MSDGSIKKIQMWLADMKLKLADEEDSMERVLIGRRINHVENNLKHYFIPRINKGQYHYFCAECGEIELGGYSNKVDMEEKGLCFGCHHWMKQEAEYLSNKKGTLIIAGKIYGDAGATSGRNTQYNGFAGAEFHIRMLDGSKEWKTNNLWCGGEIPKKYRETTMQDNAEFIK